MLPNIWNKTNKQTRSIWRPVLVKIMTIKLRHKSILIQLQQQVLWTCCVFLSSLNNTFFSVLVIIFSNKNYFCFNYTKYFFHSCNELFFSGTSNYFSNVYQELFFNWAVNYFSRYREFIFWSTMHCGLCIEVDWFESLTSLGDHFENFASGGVLSKRMSRRNIVRERKERGFHLSYKICQELVVRR